MATPPARPVPPRARRASPPAAGGPKAAVLDVPSPLREPVGQPETGGRQGRHEPVWLVRMVLVLFLVGFAAFLASEVRGFLQALP